MKLTMTISRLLNAMRRIALGLYPATQDRSVSYRFHWDERPSWGGCFHPSGLQPLELRTRQPARRR